MKWFQIRIATEGINGTVSGTVSDTTEYMNAVLNHPLFDIMLEDDFKVSNCKFYFI